jgi:hypothetical protein
MNWKFYLFIAWVLHYPLVGLLLAIYLIFGS